MGVIGRLDEQVDEIIIGPVGARRGPAESQPPQPTAPPPPEPLAKEEETGDAGRAGADASELPVWLL